MREAAPVSWCVMASVDFSYLGYPTLSNEGINELVVIFRGKDHKAVFVWEKGGFFVFLFFWSWDGCLSVVHCVTAGQVMGELILGSTRVLCSVEMERMRLPCRSPQEVCPHLLS